MFQTLQPQNIRINKTAAIANRRKLHYQKDFTERPHTVGYNDQNMTITSQTNHFKTIDLAQLQISHSFHKQMSPYIKQKIRNSLSLNNQRKLFFRRQSVIEDPEQKPFSAINNKTLNFFSNTFTANTSLPSNLQQPKLFTFLNKQPSKAHPLHIKSKQIISECLITNTKQKINRMILMKKEKEEEFMEIKRSVKSRCTDSKSRHLRWRSSTGENTNKEYQLPAMEDEKWDKQWKEQLNKETNRYRNRLMAKHKRDMSMKIQVSENQNIIQA